MCESPVDLPMDVYNVLPFIWQQNECVSFYAKFQTFRKSELVIILQEEQYVVEREQ